MIDSYRYAIGMTALIVLALIAVLGSIAAVQRRYGDRAGAALLLGYLAGGLLWLAVWGLA